MWWQQVVRPKRVEATGLRAMFSSKSGSINGTSVTVSWVLLAVVEWLDRPMEIASLDISATA